uniref:BTB domain-containing protein n=1 Tax=Panagrolaimus sp. ES5 TaxID=591445 RepID=A0AC34FAE1_9BILA
MEFSTSTELICPFDKEWKFKKADLIALKDSKDGFLAGKFFYASTIPGLQYHVRIYPNGASEKQRGDTWVYFFMKCTDERKTTADFEILIESSNYGRSFKRTYDSEQAQGISFKKLFEYGRKYFVDGEITIRVKGTLKVERPLISKISSPISMEWKIKKEDLEAKKEVSFGFLRSKRIIVSPFSDMKYFISICPNSIRDGKPPGVEIFLNIEMEKGKKVEAVFDFSFDTSNLNVPMQKTLDISGGYGIGFCSTADLFDPAKGYFAGGFFVIKLQGILMVEKNQYTMLNCKKGFATKAAQKKRDKDFTIVVGEKEIKAILMDASPVLSAMFECGLKESTENKMDIKDFTFEVVDAAVKLCYSSGNLVEEYLIKKICPSNVCQFIQFSKTFNAAKLYQSCFDHLIIFSKDATPVYGLDILDKDLIVTLFMSSFRSVVDTDADTDA